MFNNIRHQLFYYRSNERKASLLFKILMRLKYDCYISIKADIYHYQKIKLGKDVHIYNNALLNFKSGYSSYGTNIDIGDKTKIFPYAKIIPQNGYIKVGKNCTIQYGCLLYGAGGLAIGDDVRIAAETIIAPMNHVYENTEVPIWWQGETAKGINIGNDVWLGSNVKVLDGVSIGHGAVVGAGSVVNVSIPPMSVAVGVPAKVIKRR